jgi:hypothetical protein
VGRSVRGVSAAAVVAFVGSLALPVALPASETGCAGDDCDSDTATWGSCTQGDRIDADTWESGPVSGQAYLNFHGERTWILDPSPWMGSREPVGFQAYLSLTALPNVDGGGGFTQSAGNLAEITPVQVGGVWKVEVLNDTCAQYYLRVVLTYAALDGSAENAGACGADAGG